MSDDISTLGKGAIPSPPDSRDYQFETVFGALQIDFSKEFRLPEPPNEHQGNSLSCVAQATSYLHWQLRHRDYSRRDLYSEIHLPNGGAYLRDGVARIANYGQATRDEVPDPKPETENGMRDASGVTREKQSSDKEKTYFSLGNNSIDLIATAVRDYYGAIFGVNGNNAGWSDLTNPKPPASGQVEWGHALYAMGYHMHSGQKCIIAKSSWCSNTHHEHHIKQDYFNANMTFDCWTLIPTEEIPMNPNVVIYKNGSEYQLAFKAVSEQGFAQQLLDAGCPSLVKDGKPNFVEIDKIAHVL